jgi:microcystin-dependent protein
MADIGDKSFTTDMIQLIKDAVKAELGTNAFINRYLAEVTVVNSTTSEITVKLSGSDVATDGFRSRGLQLPSVGDQVIACVDGQDRWIESVVRPATSTPYLQISSGVITGIAGAPTGSVVGWLTGTAPTGWLFCDGTSYAYNTYPALGALLGGSAGGNFNVPDMRDRVLGGLSATGTWSNTSGSIGPNTTMTEATHLAHTHTLDHTHEDNFSQGAGSVAAHAAHYHTANAGEGTTGDGSSFQGKVTIVASGSNASLIGHTHTFNPAADITTQPEDINGTNITMTHSVTAGTLSGSVTTLGTSTTTANLDMTSTSANRTLKSTLLNFIIKT